MSIQGFFTAAILVGTLISGVQAQCGAVISSFPYAEGFEGAPAWTAGGNASDWTWGTPNKPVITGAGEGLRCWNVGGLSGSFYSNGQQSWLEGPCFDLSTLQYPWISFKLFWETERAYDGLGFQYSLDQGGTWMNLGSFNGPSDCLNANWFNTSNIVGLNQASPRQGWSGRLGATVGNCGGGDGSGAWVTASQCLTTLAGHASVKFRFIFGAGTVCNNFDGIGIDDIRISEAPANAAGFVFACNGNTVDFQDASAQCPNSRSWNFGDPASAGANTANGAAVSHTFSSAGSYIVTLTVSGPCNAPSTLSRTLYIPDPQYSVEQPTCSATDGSIALQLTNAPPNLSYTWQPGGTGTNTLTGLGPGTYTLTVAGPDVCSFHETFVLTQQGDPLTATNSIGPVSCFGDDDGTAAVSVSGGTMPYTYDWAPIGGNAASATSLPSGTYTCTVTDAQGCSLVEIMAVSGPQPLTILPLQDLQLCTGSSVELNADVQGGTAPYTMIWSPDGPLVSPGITTVYTVVVTDANGCVGSPQSATVTVATAVEPAFTMDVDSGCTPHCVTFTASGIPPGATSVWSFGDGSSSDTAPQVSHCYTFGGLFEVLLTVTDPASCSGTASGSVSAVDAPLAQFVNVPAVATVDDPRFTFRDASSAAVSWSWSFGDPAQGTSNERDPEYTYQAVGCYTVALRVGNTLGCSDSTSAEVCVEDAFVLWAPNAFTPNADGYNDVFSVVTTISSTDLFALSVYDRWGRCVWTSSELSVGWDGRSNGAALPHGIYSWMVEVRDRQGIIRKASGHTTLLR